MSVYCGGNSSIVCSMELIGQYTSDVNNNINSPHALEQLGIAPTDIDAKKVMTQLLSAVSDSQSVKIVASEDSGVYFFQNSSSENIAAFKVGRKRAALELQARKIAHWLHLDSTVIPGTFVAVTEPPLLIENETKEDLWNGKEKVYIPDRELDFPIRPTHAFTAASNSSSPNSSPQKPSPSKLNPWITPDEPSFSSDSSSPFSTSQMDLSPVSRSPQRKKLPTPRKLTFDRTVVGILQPFLKEQNEKASTEDFLLMTISAIALGLRDGKRNGYCHSTLIDVEDSMPVRLDPLNEKAWPCELSATHLPYLDKDERTTEKISPEALLFVKQLASSWDIAAIQTKLSQETLSFEDPRSEIKPYKDIDEGGYCMEIAEKYPPHEINGTLSRIGDENPQKLIFDERQLNAFSLRLQRMKTYILNSKEPFSVQELVFAVDHYAEKFFKILTAQSSSPSILKKGELRSSSQIVNERDGPFHVIGKKTAREFSTQLKTA